VGVSDKYDPGLSVDRSVYVSLCKYGPLYNDWQLSGCLFICLIIAVTLFRVASGRYILMPPLPVPADIASTRSTECSRWCPHQFIRVTPIFRYVIQAATAFARPHQRLLQSRMLQSRSVLQTRPHLRATL